MRWLDLDHMINTDSLVITQGWEYHSLDHMNVMIILTMFTTYGVSFVTTVPCYCQCQYYNIHGYMVTMVLSTQ